jgi:hypothetical protein
MKDMKNKSGLEDDENILSAMMGQKVRYPEEYKSKILADGPESNQFRYDEMNNALIDHGKKAYQNLMGNLPPKQELDTLKYNMMNQDKLSPLEHMRLYDGDNLHYAHDFAQQVI